jgi:predicted nucleic acid-binding Zn ribbon protein
MVIFTAILLTAAALAALAYPIIRRNAGAASAPAAEGTLSSSATGALPHQEQVEELLAQRDSALQALRELTFDRQVGKISDEDFSIFETNLKLAAAGVFRSLDDWERTADSRLGPAFTQDVAARIERMKTGQAACPACGRAVPASDRFCANCGASLAAIPPPPVAASPGICPHCGKAAEPGDRFCGECGKPLPELEKVLAR